MQKVELGHAKHGLFKERVYRYSRGFSEFDMLRFKHKQGRMLWGLIPWFGTEYVFVNEATKESVILELPNIQTLYVLE